MSTLIYSPGIRVVIETTSNGIIDVTEDLQNGSLSLREERPSSFNFSLLNHRRKYDGLFTPNDLISVSMKRFKWLQVFSGYLDQVPFFSVYPRDVQLSATCTLKRLKYRPWDPGAQASVQMIIEALADGSDRNDGGMRDVMIAMLHDVGDWNYRNIHIGQLPERWSKGMEPLRKKVLKDIEGGGPGNYGVSGAGATPNLSWTGTHPGQSGAGIGGSGGPKGGTGNNASPGSLPIGPQASRTMAPSSLAFPGLGGKKMIPKMPTEEATTNTSITGILSTNEAAAAEYSPASGEAMSLTGESKSSPRDEWHARMKFPFTYDGRNPPPGVSRSDFNKAKAWWKNRPLLVTNPTSLRSVVLRAADWGDSDSDVQMSGHAMRTIDAAPGQRLDVRFAPESAIPGQVYGKGSVLRDVSVSGIASKPYDEQKDTIPSLPWVGADNLKANVNAARAFIDLNWPGVISIGGYRVDPGSDHNDGLALDVMVAPSNTRATGAQEVLGNTVAMWFASNPQVFGNTYVIWMDRIISAARQSEGWRVYLIGGGPTSPAHTLQHRDHPHLSFAPTGQTSAGPMGGAWSGVASAPFANNVTQGPGIDPSGIVVGGGPGTTTDPAGNMLNFDWVPGPSVDSQILTGYRALINDVPLLGSLDTIAKASMRSYMSGPNGDFIAWFPDYFGVYGTAARMNIRDMELAGNAFSITWSDNNLATHQFSIGSFHGLTNNVNSPLAQAGDIYYQARTNGIASVEFPELMEALFNISRDDPRAQAWFNPNAILKRFGARPNVTNIGMVSSPTMEFWHACRMFQKNWAAQFSAQVQLTFMPEIWPGMLLKLETFGFQAYVEEVTHTFDFQEGMSSGFRTSVSIIAPSATDGSGLFGLPRAGNNKQKD